MSHSAIHTPAVAAGWRPSACPTLLGDSPNANLGAPARHDENCRSILRTARLLPRGSSRPLDPRPNIPISSIARNPNFTLPTLVILGAIILALLAFGLHRISRSPGRPGNEAPRPAATAEPTSLYGALLGRWLRTDGDYLLDIRAIDGAGKAQVDYFNPRPIHVARAEAAREGDILKIVVVLEDVGYPGSHYTLVHSPGKKQLTGEYYQAALQETFEIVFTRLP